MINFLKSKGIGLTEFILALIIFFSRIPPLSLVNIGINMNIYSLIGILLCFLTISLIYKKKIISRHGISTSIFILVYFLSLSISIINARNITSFLSNYKDVILGLLIFFVVISSVTKKNVHIFIFILLIASFFNISYQLIAIYLSDIAKSNIDFFIHDKYIQFFNFQMGRGRFFGDSFDEVYLCLFFPLLVNGKNIKMKVFTGFVILGTIYISLISNWRSKTILMMIAIIVICIQFVIRKMHLVLLSIILAIVLIISFIGSNYYFQSANLEIISRLNFKDTQDIKTINSRFSLWNKSLEIVKSSPLVGIGLGNFYDYLNSRQKSNNRVQLNTGAKFIVIDDPHNLFFSVLASGGLIGFISLISLLTHLLYIDAILLIREHTYLNIGLVISFWLLFLYAFLNPWQYYAFLSQFWYIRGLLFIQKYG